MPNITINDREYDVDSLPDAAKQQLQMLAACEAEIKHLQTQLAIAQTARNAYRKALIEAAQSNDLPSGDTLKL